MDVIYLLEINSKILPGFLLCYFSVFLFEHLGRLLTKEASCLREQSVFPSHTKTEGESSTREYKEVTFGALLAFFEIFLKG